METLIFILLTVICVFIIALFFRVSEYIKIKKQMIFEDILKDRIGDLGYFDYGLRRDKMQKLAKKLHSETIAN